MERVFRLFESLGYPRKGTDRLRRKRGWVIVVLAILAWIVILAIGFGLAMLFLYGTSVLAE